MLRRLAWRNNFVKMSIDYIFAIFSNELLPIACLTYLQRIKHMSKQRVLPVKNYTRIVPIITYICLLSSPVLPWRLYDVRILIDVMLANKRRKSTTLNSGDHWCDWRSLNRNRKSCTTVLGIGLPWAKMGALTDNRGPPLELPCPLSMTMSAIVAVTSRSSSR